MKSKGVKCKAICGGGQPCKHKAVMDGYCVVHILAKRRKNGMHLSVA